MKNMQDKNEAKKAKLLKKEAKTKAKFEKKMAKRLDNRKKAGKITVEKNDADWISDVDQTSNSVETNSTDEKGFWNKFSKNREFKKTLYDRKDLKREKEEKQKTDYKLAFKEFPVKMVKEVNKIKWSGKKNLTTKFLQVIIFMIVFAVIFYLVDWAFQAIFAAIHVV